MSHTWPDVLTALVAGHDLDAGQTAWAMGEIVAGEATPAQVAGFAVALRAKGETVEELIGLLEAMYAVATPISVEGRLLDVVGTGGDRSMSVNISTMAAIVAAGAGARVVKHGNRSASSASGSADVLEALGIRLDLPPDRVAELADEVGITFCFAAAFHPGMRHTAVPRRELGVAHHLQPARPARQPDPPGRPGDRLRRPAHGAGHGRGVRRARRRRVGRPRRRRPRRAHDDDHLVGVAGPRRRGHARPRSTRRRSGSGWPRPRSLRGGDVAHNADVVRRLLDGEQGPVRDAVLLNAGRGARRLRRPRSSGRGRAAGAHRAGRGGRRLRRGAGDLLDRWVAASRAELRGRARRTAPSRRKSWSSRS